MKTTKQNTIDTFTHNVVFLRKTNHISKKRMAKILGISIYSLNQIEKGLLPPKLSVEVLFKIRSYFHVSEKQQVEKKLDE